MLDSTESMHRLHRALARLAFYIVLTTWLATVVPVICEHGLTSPYVHARFGHGAIHVVLPVSAVAAPAVSPIEDVPHDEGHDTPAHPFHQAYQAHGSHQAYLSQGHLQQKDDGPPAPTSVPAVQRPGARSAPPAHIHPAALSAIVSSQPQFSGPLMLLSAGLLVPAQPLPADWLRDTIPLSIYLPPERLPDPPPERPPARPAL